MVNTPLRFITLITVSAVAMARGVKRKKKPMSQEDKGRLSKRWKSDIDIKGKKDHDRSTCARKLANNRIGEQN